jgi:hypothetical protein
MADAFDVFIRYRLRISWLGAPGESVGCVHLETHRTRVDERVTMLLPCGLGGAVATSGATTVPERRQDNRRVCLVLAEYNQ